MDCVVKIAVLGSGEVTGFLGYWKIATFSLAMTVFRGELHRKCYSFP